MPRLYTNRKILIKEIAHLGNCRHEDARFWLDVVTKAITATVTKTGYLCISGFGSFRYRTLAGRKLYNVQTGKVIDVPARALLKFNPDRTLNKTLFEEDEETS